MKKIFILLLITANCSLAFCQQTATDAIKQTVNNLFTAMCPVCYLGGLLHYLCVYVCVAFLLL